MLNYQLGNSPVEICGILTDIVKSAQKFVTQNIGCAEFVCSNISHRDKDKNYLFTVIPSTNKYLLFFKVSIPMCLFKTCLTF